MTPYKHSQSSAKKFGGRPEDYIAIHEWFDCTKQYTGDWTHRALRHHSAGVQWCIEQFGHTIHAGGKIIPVKPIAEQHVMEDCGFIPTPQDWLKGMNRQAWMLRVAVKNVEQMEVSPEPGENDDQPTT